MSDRPTKITFAEMRDMGVHGVLVYCQDYKCSHSLSLSADRWPDNLRLSDIEPQFVCKACGKRGAEVRPDFNWDKMPGGISVFIATVDQHDESQGRAVPADAHISP
jgi:hypothetical protein